jgi:hypothetical protein
MSLSAGYRHIPDTRLVVDDCSLYRIKRGKVDEDSNFKTKTYNINGKPTVYWICGDGLRIPVAKTILTAWKGTKPGGSSIFYKDGNRENCRLTNLDWKPKENKSGNMVGITYDKSKDRWRVQCKGLKRSCHKTKTEAIATLMASGAVIESESEADDDDDKTINSEVSEIEEIPADEKALHKRLDAQFNKANGISGVEIVEL